MEFVLPLVFPGLFKPRAADLFVVAEKKAREGRSTSQGPSALVVESRYLSRVRRKTQASV